MESYILTRTMHLGHLKETFGKGALIQFNPETRKLIIDGRRFDDYRDVEILKRQAIKNPHNPWIIQYSEEAMLEMRGGSEEVPSAIPARAPNSEGMEIVQSDEDAHETIDIRHTQVSKINNAAKEAARNKTKNQDLPIIQGDESVEDRIARLKDAKDTDISARAERVRLMGARKASMPVVHDDSLGHVGGSNAAPLNAGMPVGGRRADEAKEETKAAADSRKREIEMNRQKVAEEMGMDLDQAGIDEVAGMTPAEVTVSAESPVPVIQPPRPESEAIAKDAEIAQLKARLAQLEDGEASVEMPEPAEEPAAPKKAKKMPVVSS